MTGFPALIASSAVCASSREDTPFFTTSSASPRPSYFAYSAKFIDTAPSLNLPQVRAAPVIWTDIPQIIKDRCERRRHDIGPSLHLAQCRDMSGVEVTAEVLSPRSI